ncbi:DUF305 domain-containing protein [uncultured Cellulomonas sp.]|uniref:DUF305 domain-containing protein n=1 Tax=uncultured Cellulomonas sp. TaxID=189682 RepID=UPI0026286528|nr:DUF305 domain-containing protein [uncultured Cellulomonas sp.]
MDLRRARGAAIGGALALPLALAGAGAAPAGGLPGEATPGCPHDRGVVAGTWGEARAPGAPIMPITGTMPGHGAVTVTGEADYLARMIPHHEEAVTAARELQRSARPQLRELGESIEATQTDQLVLMRAWLRRWYPGTAPAQDPPMMRDLGALGGAELDQAFLRDMIPHHMAAVMMSQGLLRRHLAEHEEVADLADQIRDGQRAEIALMRALWHEPTGTTDRWMPPRRTAAGR